MNNETKRYDFAAPFVPSADPLDGLLQSSELENDLIVKILLWDDVLPEYVFQLIWDGVFVGEIKSIAKFEKPGDLFSMLLPAEYLKNDGNYRLGFRVTDPMNTAFNDSPEVSIIINRTLPGGALLAGLCVPSVTLGETLAGQIPGYANMSTGDVIQSFCNNVEGPSVAIQPEHLTTTPISIRFDRSFLQSLNSDEVSIGYRVTDRAGNVSIMSQLVTLTLQA